ANNPAELAQRLNAVIDGTVTGPLVAAAQVLANEYSGGAPAPAQQPQQTFQQPPAQNQGFQQQQTPTAPQGGGQVETDRWGGTYEHGRPDAPQTMHGPKVLKRAISQAGKPYAQWLEPRDPKIPSVYQANGKTPPPDLIPAEFARVQPQLLYSETSPPARACIVPAGGVV